ncbi:MBL fold metallo-hydrolase [uncultured Tateyamaria sp.]|uniref:MBL fold metallo-hydrolase n=1 Tax=uncultured Tateyamaria sp. TaxID=455651 RepID=UPI0026322414|nr:MBL fold metallo-hydrolase [uncultured Tateyamaria sp.]
MATNVSPGFARLNRSNRPSNLIPLPYRLGVFLSLIACLLGAPDDSQASEVQSTFLGTTTIVFKDQTNSILIDGFCSRPSFATLLTSKVTSDCERVEDCLYRARVKNLSGVFVAHTHYDHVMDAPFIAKHTGARIYGSRSTLAVARGEGVTDDKLQNIKHGQRFSEGEFEVQIFETPHVYCISTIG